MGSRSCDVLVVEDNPDDAQMTLRALGRLKPQPAIEVAIDGDQAVRFLFEGGLRPRLVLLDLKLPKLHGLEVLERVKAEESLETIPIVVLTSSDDPSDVARARQLGAADYVCKPVDWIDYRQQVCDAAERYLPESKCD